MLRSNDVVLNVENVTVHYKEKTLLENISFKLREGEVLAVLGESGSGRTTLLLTIAGVLKGMSNFKVDGIVRVYGKNVEELTPIEKTKVMGILLQDPESQFTSLRVEDEISFTLENLNYDPARIDIEVDRVLKMFNIEHLKGRLTYTLSGGEKQKVALASTLSLKPTTSPFRQSRCQS